MPLPSIATSPDHRIFGFDQRGQLRANLHNGSTSYAPGAMYSWVACATAAQLAHKLETLWEQSLSAAEWDVIEELEASNAEFEIDCDECGATGVDPGGLNPYEPEDCPACHGAKRMTVASVMAPKAEAA